MCKKLVAFFQCKWNNKKSSSYDCRGSKNADLFEIETEDSIYKWLILTDG